MNNFTFYSPTYFAFGKDAENDTGQLSDTQEPPDEVMDGDRTALPE